MDSNYLACLAWLALWPAGATLEAKFNEAFIKPYHGLIEILI